MTRVAVPNFGNYTIPLAASVECLGAEPWCSMSTPETTRLGIEAAPESTCLPFKANLGHFLKAAQDGVEYAVMVNSVGTCRLRYYRDLQQKILDRMNVRMHIFTLGYDGLKPPLIRYFDPSPRIFLAGVARAAMKIKLVDSLELQAWRTRALELRPGDTTKVMHACLQELEEAKTVREIRALRKAIPGRFRAIPVEEGREPLKVALVGEATVLRDKYLNHNVEDILGALGVQVHNFFLLGLETKKIFHLEFSSRHSRRGRLKIARPYLKSLVGGHAIETISNTIYSAQDGYDGAVHIYPTGCMPEVSIKPILSKISQDYRLPILNCSFDEHTSHVGIVTRIETFVDLLYESKNRAGSLTRMNDIGYLGIDVGSISTNIAVIDPGGEVLFTLYARGGGNPIQSVQRGLQDIREELSENFRIAGVCTTGSGRNLIGAVVGADLIKNEIVTHARAVLHLHPNVRTIFEIGGQDSKVTIIQDGVIVGFAMNLVCAAGTGSFLDSQAKRLGITTEELSEMSILSENPTDIAGRCTVFAESDMIHKQQIGHDQKDIMMGLCQALVRNYLNNVCRGNDLQPPYVLQGGVSANKGIRRALEQALGGEVIIPRYNMVMGAYGAALRAASAGIEKTRFRGYVVSDRDVATRSFQCEDCSNDCEIIEIADQGEVIGNCGGRCGKWEAQKRVPVSSTGSAHPLGRGM